MDVYFLKTCFKQPFVIRLPPNYPNTGPKKKKGKKKTDNEASKLAENLLFGYLVAVVVSQLDQVN